VLTLRRKATPTDSELQNQISQMVDEALELVVVEPHSHPHPHHGPGDVTESFIPPLQGDIQAEAAEP
jgi:hypothetical protein